MTPIVLYYYVTESGKPPFLEWLNSIRDKKTVAAIDVRLDRIVLGNFGDCKAIGDDLYELRIFSGPGYRIYFGREETSIIILLSGGDKSSQKRDIDKAKEYWSNYRSREDNDKKKTI